MKKQYLLKIVKNTDHGKSDDSYLVSMTCAGSGRSSPEQGRSMVEMLGVLAIVGVLSIGGIAGYRFALNRYRANEIFDGITKRMIVAKTQNASGQRVNLSEFSDKISGLYYNIKCWPEEKGCILVVHSIDEGLCTSLKSLSEGSEYDVYADCGGGMLFQNINCSQLGVCGGQMIVESWDE